MIDKSQRQLYKITSSLLDKWLWYLNCSDAYKESAMTQLKNALLNIWPDNVYTDKGQTFEQEAVDGKHGKISQLVKDLPTQVFGGRVLDTAELSFHVTGKFDFLDTKRKRIIDLKRVKKLYRDKWTTDRQTLQHLLYFYMTLPEYETFYYVIAHGEGDKYNIEVVQRDRPETEELLEQLVKQNVLAFIEFLRRHDLLQDYLNNYKSKVKRENIKYGETQ